MKSNLTFEKPLPHNLDAERAMLGAIVMENSLFDQAAEIVTRDDFFDQAHRRIFETMTALAGESRPIDSITLTDELHRNDSLEAVGGVGYLASLLDGTPRVKNVEQYAAIIKEKSLLRRLIHTSNEILVRCFNAEEEAAELLESAEKAVYEIGQERIRGGFQGLDELLGITYQHIQNVSQRQGFVTGISSGFIDLDSMTSGFQKSDMIVLAARPGLGKTSLALNIAQHAAIKEERIVGVFSLEMSGQQLVSRLLCAEARVDSHKVRNGFLSQEDWGSLARAMGRLSQAKMYIDDSPGLTMVEMRAKARRLKARHGLDLLIVDYLQLMSGAAGAKRAESRQQEISAISRGIKLLAKELDIPVLALSQLSRAPEQRKGDHRPQLSDLRESGSIEQDADMVFFIYRPDLYKKDDELDEEAGVAQIIIGKQRNGPTGKVKLAFIEQWTKFENLARDDYDEVMG